ncbi:hypothetical protein LIER_34403 [Lithospermum erythrorhizon]|uniref:HMG box domain-containing protein n=1 Tax=Lithospermum erythrorhizon TaxID=34254 RepID=A0AAV3S2H1_LITER
MAGAKANARGHDSKLAVTNKPMKGRKAKAVKDPNKPKRPPSAFFVFMEGFRPEFKAEHPDNKSVAVVGKAGGEKWKSLSDTEKAPFIAIADERKADYEKIIRAYNRKLAGEAEEEESDKSKSEVNDNEDDDVSGEEDEDDA